MYIEGNVPRRNVAQGDPDVDVGECPRTVTTRVIPSELAPPPPTPGDELAPRASYDEGVSSVLSTCVAF